MTKKQKKRAAAATAAALLLLLLWKNASARSKATAKITIGPTVVTDRDETSVELLRQKRAALRYRVLDFIGWNEDTGEPTRRPTTADLIVLEAIARELAALRTQIPDPEGLDASFDEDLTAAVTWSQTLDPSTSSRPAAAFGASRYMTRLISIEKVIADTVAMDSSGQPRRRPTDGELATANLLVFEANDLRSKILALDPEAEVSPLDLDAILAVAKQLPKSTSAVAAISVYRGAVA